MNEYTFNQNDKIMVTNIHIIIITFMQGQIVRSHIYSMDSIKPKYSEKFRPILESKIVKIFPGSLSSPQSIILKTFNRVCQLRQKICLIFNNQITQDISSIDKIMTQCLQLLQVKSRYLDFQIISNQQVKFEWKSLNNGKVHYCKSIQEECLFLKVSLIIMKINYACFPLQNKYLISQWQDRLQSIRRAIFLAQQVLQYYKNKRVKLDLTLTEMEPEIIYLFKLICVALEKKLYFFTKNRYSSILRNEKNSQSVKNTYWAFQNFGFLIQQVQKNKYLNNFTKNIMKGYFTSEFYFFKAVFYYQMASHLKTVPGKMQKSLASYYLSCKSFSKLKHINQALYISESVEQMHSKALSQVKRAKFKESDTTQMEKKIKKQMKNVSQRNPLCETTVIRTSWDNQVKLLQLQFKKLSKSSQQFLKKSEKQLEQYKQVANSIQQQYLTILQQSKQSLQSNNVRSFLNRSIEQRVELPHDLQISAIQTRLVEYSQQKILLILNQNQAIIDNCLIQSSKQSKNLKRMQKISENRVNQNNECLSSEDRQIIRLIEQKRSCELQKRLGINIGECVQQQKQLRKYYDQYRMEAQKIQNILGNLYNNSLQKRTRENVYNNKYHNVQQMSKQIRCEKQRIINQLYENRDNLKKLIATCIHIAKQISSHNLQKIKINKQQVQKIRQNLKNVLEYLRENQQIYKQLLQRREQVYLIIEKRYGNQIDPSLQQSQSSIHIDQDSQRTLLSSYYNGISFDESQFRQLANNIRIMDINSENPQSSNSNNIHQQSQILQDQCNSFLSQIAIKAKNGNRK